MLLSVSLIGILNLECAVRPPGIIDAAIPDVEVAIAFRPIERTFASNALYRYVFLCLLDCQQRISGFFGSSHDPLCH
uniref:Secreted protein n=1 Tax=Triticum urartu TaxID=4572 RepID=A0A8R7TCF9_TRIUA